MTLNAFAASHPGMKRTSNQDAFLCAPSVGLFVVADGMGGHSGGQIASQIAIKTFLHHQQRIQSNDSSLKEVLNETSSRIFRLATSNAQLKGMGTTLSCCHIKKTSRGHHISYAHVGDSRIYLIMEHRIWQLSKDHSLIDEQIDAGILSREEAEHKIGRNVLVRSVGISQNLEVDIFAQSVQFPSYLLICSDGLSNMLETKDILEIIHRNTTNTKESVEQLIELSNKSGGDDNITAILVALNFTS